MYYVLALIVGIISGGVFTWLYVMDRHARLMTQVKSAASQAERARGSIQECEDSKQHLRLREKEMNEAAAARSKTLDQREFALSNRETEFEHRLVSYREIRDENTILKRDLQNIDVNLNKLHLDGEVREEKQKELDSRVAQLGRRYLNETVKAVVSALGPSNFAACKQRLVDAISRCREIGLEVSPEEEARLLTDLRAEFENEVRTAFAKEEQARIKAQIREEEKLKREIDRELKQLERERAAIQAALDQALAAAQGQHSAEVERLQARLTEAEEKSKRAISMAQQTKAGHVYVISNVGTFGLDVFKIGMTRRLDPKERVIELGSASVPFPFDVHLMISCTDAPKLENALHRALHRSRVNKANPRKEFFRVTLNEIVKIVTDHHGVIDYKADPEALEYHQSLTMTEEDSLFIEQVYDSIEGQAAPTDE